MDIASVMAWVAEYERVWREDDVAALDGLFTEGARYLHSPYDPPLEGLDTIRERWSDPTPFTMTSVPVAVQGRDAVVRVEVQYGGEKPQEYRDLWVLRFADDGRAELFEEWAYWPGKPYSASGAGGTPGA
jgi:ketosteroid isomerase-like protein